MNGDHISRASQADLDSLLTNLDVSFVKLLECMISPGWRLALAETNMAVIYYNVKGMGRLTIGNHPPIDLVPRTLIIAPPNQPFRIDGAISQGPAPAPKVRQEQWQSSDNPGMAGRLIAGNGTPAVTVICGCFRAFYGMSIDLFTTLPSPIVEHFESADDLDHILKSMLAETAAQQIGMKVMTTTLLKQVLVMVLRRSLDSSSFWLERFSLLSDPQIVRAFADMVARPRAPHRIQTLAQTAGLSRSAFMAHFANSFGQSPMAALRDLRMHRAASLLAGGNKLIDQVARDVGYANRSSFQRAFQKAYGTDPSSYRATARPPLGQ